MYSKVLIGLSILAVPSLAFAYSVAKEKENRAISFTRQSNNIFYFPEQDAITVNPENIKTTSARGKQLIKNTESLRLSVYLDQAGLPTIGYGHLIGPDEFFDTIDEEEADTLLAFDLNDAETCIINTVEISLTQNEFDALVSFVFNVGCGNFSTSTLLRKLNDGDKQGAADELKRWKYVTIEGEKVASNGLIKRREDEKNLFLA